MKGIGYTMMLMLLFHLVAIVKAESHLFSRLPMNHTKLDSQNMKLPEVICAIVSAKDEGTENIIGYDSCLIIIDLSASFMILRINLIVFRFERLLLQPGKRRRLRHR